MRLRIVDYVANPGGGMRFAVEMIRALLRRKSVEIEVVSWGKPLQRYFRALDGCDDVRFCSVRPSNWRATRGRMYARIPLAGPLLRLSGLGLQPHFDVARELFDDGATLWFPWAHFHRLPESSDGPIIGSLHDAIAIEYPGYAGSSLAHSEMRTIRSWIDSSAALVVSSRATASTLHRLFAADVSRFAVVPLAGDHLQGTSAKQISKSWPWADAPFLICPANLSPHKNVETLLDAMALWRGRIPLVLTGPGTDLRVLHPRALMLRLRARRVKLRIGRDFFPLGYVSSDDYSALLRRAWALVMPTLAEGGGSFPVWEALTSGIPVVCSDIPVMREMLSRVGGRVLWFDARSPGDLASRLEELRANHDRFRQQATSQVTQLLSRSWSDVASEYITLLCQPDAAGL